ncbi:hypothetical protein EUX98_g6365 [Antrodiella citrinella]|uniref:Cytochrome P450 n=1 Tax=Antrodiella citrinella TaxID=2447956 RepID=A0A4S4MQ06_9APHY|nr:hypothetical protein EUX98_g6365 [Antrodiella citrinella]
MFLLDILRTPLHTRKHVRQVTTSIIFFITYGKRVTGMDDEAVTTSQLAVEGANAAGVPGRFWIEFLPFLKNVPSWVPARNSEKYSGTEDEPFYDDVARNVAGVAYAAGADTTTSACESFLTAMAMFPTVQKKAQEELDRIVGLHRLPEFDDFEKMPYVRAIVMEVMRWVPVLPFGIPHALTTDDVYDGYHIPKGTAVIPNAWAMLHDPEDYPEPELFKPERFIGKDGRIDVNVRDPSTIAFGFGRRMCPGRHFSNNTLSILIASTLHVFDVTAGVDASGKLVELNPEMIGGTITPWPIIGNALDMPTIRPWEKYCQWCKTYNSNIIYLHLPMRPVNPVKVAFDLPDKRSSLYSDRIRNVMFELFIPYTASQDSERIAGCSINIFVMAQYRPVQLQDVRMFLSDVLKTPASAHTRKHVRQYVHSLPAAESA